MNSEFTNVKVKYRFVLICRIC